MKKQFRVNGARKIVLVVAIAAGLAGCSTYDSLTQRVAQSITPYRITVVQGNFVSSEAAAKMHVGMTRAEVRTTLGTPLLTDMFHADRWDYLFYFKRGFTSVVQKRDFVVHFKDDHVASWEGGADLPSELELLADIDGDKRGTKSKAASVVAATPASASDVSAASAPAAEAPAPAAAAAASAPAAATEGETSVPAAAAAAAASGVPAQASEDPNFQAAQAANRAVNQSSSDTPSVRAGAPSPGGHVGATPQFHFQIQPQPASPNRGEPVGPAGAGNNSEPSSSGNQPVSSSAAGQGAGG